MFSCLILRLGIGGINVLILESLESSQSAKQSRIHFLREVPPTVGLVNKYRGSGSEQMGDGSLDYEPSQRGGSLNLELTKGGGSPYL